MGLFGKKKDLPAIKITISLETSSRGNKADSLLKKATEKKQSGELNEAILLLREAYKEFKSTGIISPINTYLRLPMYLQAAGRDDEAWSEFSNLVSWINSGSGYSPEVIPMEQSIVWDKMRLFLQREGKNQYAVTFSVLSYLSWCVGLYKQRRKNELKEYISSIAISNSLSTPLKKAGKETYLPEISHIMNVSLKSLPNVSYADVSTKIQKVFLTH